MISIVMSTTDKSLQIDQSICNSDHHLLFDNNMNMDKESNSNRRKLSVDDDNDDGGVSLAVAITSDNANSTSDSLDHPGNEIVDSDDEEEFLLSLGSHWEEDDGDWDDTIISSSPSPTQTIESQEPALSTNEHMKRSRPSSPMTHLPLLRRQSAKEFYVSASSLESSDEIDGGTVPKDDGAQRDGKTRCSLGNNLMISIQACNRNASAPHQHLNDSYVKDNDFVMPIMPLITPPSSPRRIQVVFSTLDSGVVTTTIMEEEATICEWPCNLTVDNAITAALELVPAVSCNTLLA